MRDALILVIKEQYATQMRRLACKLNIYIVCSLAMRCLIFKLHYTDICFTLNVYLVYIGTMLGLYFVHISIKWAHICSTLYVYLKYVGWIFVIYCMYIACIHKICVCSNIYKLCKWKICWMWTSVCLQWIATQQQKHNIYIYIYIHIYKCIMQLMTFNQLVSFSKFNFIVFIK